MLYKSLFRYNNEYTFTIVVCDKKAEIPGFFDLFIDVDLVWAEELFDTLELFYHFAFKFNVIEFNTLLKPIAFERLLNCYEQVVYLDPDIKVFNKLEFCSKSSIITTPHYTTPLGDWTNRPNDLDLLRFGANNLGFLCINRDKESAKFLKWWKSICLDYNYYEPSIGLGVDQKFIDLVPILFEKSKVNKDLGLNLAFWNLHERDLVKKENIYFVNNLIVLKFIHFSSFPLDRPAEIAEKQTIYDRFPNDVYREVWEDYDKDLKSTFYYQLKSSRYSFDHFDDQMIINDFIRRNYIDFKKTSGISNDNPFTSNSSYRKHLRKTMIRLSSETIKQTNFKSLKGKFASIDRIFGSLMKVLLVILGPYKFDLLLKYLNYKTVTTRNKHETR